MKYCFPISSLAAIFAVASLSACSDDQEYTVSGDGSLTPLSVSVSMSGASGQTRAVDHDFDANDILWAYFEHVDFSGGSQTPKTVGMSPSLVSFKVNDPVGMSQIGETSEYKTENIQVTSVMQGTLNILPEDHSVLYWDDFSSSSEPINQSNRGLRIKYGYCYNGAEPASAVNQTTGELSWSVAKDQTEGIKTNDLLWCTGTEPVSYVHDKNNRGQMAITIPYTHAMSKVTIVLTAKEGFSSSNPFENTKASLLGMYRTGKVNAALAESSRISNPGQGPSDVGIVDMHKKETIPVSETNTYAKCTFEAIVVPTNVLSLTNVIAQVTDVEGNIYNITATQAVLDAFAQSTDAESCTFKSGYNYQINVSLEKQKQTIEARITDWDNIIADNENGVIMFNPDVRNSIDATGSPASGDATFNLWYAECAGDVAGTYQGPFDIARNATLGAWNGSSLYWKDGSTKYCFRALGTYDNTKSIIKIDGENKNSAAQSVDLLWGTTSSHKGYDKDDNLVKNYGAGDPIDPRTGSVPMTFEHAMSKISVNLETSTGGSADAVDLADAKISIINLYNGGTINLNNGEIGTLSAPTDDVITIKNKSQSELQNFVVIPQSLTNFDDEDKTPRVTTPSFYSIGLMTAIYSDGTSISNGGSASFYLTSELETVVERKYTAEEASSINAELSGAVHENEDKPSPGKYSEEEAKVHNASLDGAKHAGDIMTAAVSYTDLSDYNTTNGLDGSDDTHKALSQEEFDALSDEQKIKTPAVPYTEETAATYNASLDGAVTTDSDKPSPGKYTKEEADALNAALTGAVTTADVKTPAHYKLPDGASLTAHQPGDLRDKGEKIMLYITLADGTIYSLDLASCTTTVDDVAKAVDEWKRGEHYTYTITLKKDKISFRAMVKEWEEKTGSGNATLDWD